MASSGKDAKGSADGFPLVGGSAPASGNGGDLASEAMDRAAVQAMFRAMGSPTVMAPAQRAIILAVLYKRFSASTAADKALVDTTLTYFFTVYGTSPKTDWSKVPDIVCGGVSVKAAYVVSEIGEDKLKRFCAPWGQKAIAMVDASPELQGILRERALRQGLPVGAESLAVDFAGKDGTMGSAAMAQRIAGKSSAIARARSNRVNDMDLDAEEVASEARGSFPSSARNPYE